MEFQSQFDSEVCTGRIFPARPCPPRPMSSFCRSGRHSALKFKPRPGMQARPRSHGRTRRHLVTPRPICGLCVEVGVILRNFQELWAIPCCFPLFNSVGFAQLLKMHDGAFPTDFRAPLADTKSYGAAKVPRTFYITMTTMLGLGLQTLPAGDTVRFSVCPSPF